MKLDYDKEVDALYIQFLNEKASETEELEPGIIVDFTKDACIGYRNPQRLQEAFGDEKYQGLNRQDEITNSSIGWKSRT